MFLRGVWMNSMGNWLEHLPIPVVFTSLDCVRDYPDCLETLLAQLAEEFGFSEMTISWLRDLAETTDLNLPVYDDDFSYMEEALEAEAADQAANQMDGGEADGPTDDN